MIPQPVRNVVTLARVSGDFHTFQALRTKPRGIQRLKWRFGKQTIPIALRTHTYDPTLAQLILCEDSEYRLPVPHQPKHILDIGGNIGMTALYFAATYPEARIWSFEPVPENLALLRANAQAFPDRITVIDSGLGKETGSFAFQPSDDASNFGGGSFVGNVGATTPKLDLPVITLDEAVRTYQIPQPDLIKIDVEGAEWAVVQGGAAVFAQALLIIGELHGHDDWPVLQQLEKTHKLGFTKTADQQAFHFHAVKR